MAGSSTPVVQNNNPVNLGALAREMVMGIRPRDKILEMFNIDEVQLEEITELPFYKRVHEALTVEWESATSTNKRLAVQAAAALEEILPRVVARCADANEALPAVLTGVQTLAKLAGTGEEKRESGSSERFRIVINLGSDTKELVGQGKESSLQTPLVEGTLADENHRLDPPTSGDTSTGTQSLREFSVGEAGEN